LAEGGTIRGCDEARDEQPCGVLAREVIAAVSNPSSPIGDASLCGNFIATPERTDDFSTLSCFLAKAGTQGYGDPSTAARVPVGCCSQPLRSPKRRIACERAAAVRSRALASRTAKAARPPPGKRRNRLRGP